MSRISPTRKPAKGYVARQQSARGRRRRSRLPGRWGRSARLDAFEVRLPSHGRRKLAELPFVRPGAYDAAPQDIVAREVVIRAMTEVEFRFRSSSADVKLDGSNPTILYGYGAYGVTQDLFFSPSIYAWLQRGGVYALAHVRGGGALGRNGTKRGARSRNRTRGRTGSRSPSI